MVNPIFKMFGRSPIKPLQQHMTIVTHCVGMLDEFFKAVNEADWATAAAKQLEIVRLEHEADAIKRDLRLHLPKGMFMPMPRSDVLELLSLQDSIANKSKDIAGIVLGRSMQFPPSLKEDMIVYLRRSIDAANQAAKAINELEDVLEAGFQGNEIVIVESMIVDLDQIEHDTDELQIKIRRRVFALEKELPAIEVMFLYKVVDWIGDLADRAQGVGGRLLMLLAR